MPLRFGWFVQGRCRRFYGTVAEALRVKPKRGDPALMVRTPHGPVPWAQKEIWNVETDVPLSSARDPQDSSSDLLLPTVE